MCKVPSIWIAIVISMILFFLGGCTRQNSSPGSVSGTNGGKASGIASPTLPINTAANARESTPDASHGHAEGSPVTSAEVLRPDVWLVFSGAKVELSAKAKSVLKYYWTYLLSVKKDTPLVEIVNATNSAENAISKTEIDAPTGLRLISDDESDDIVKFVQDTFIEQKDKKKGN